MATPVRPERPPPWQLLRFVFGGTLHPGGAETSRDLLDRGAVGEGTHLLDIGCGGGETLAIAKNRGANAVGLDRRAAARPSVVGESTVLPISRDSIDVVLAECTLCLADDLERALGEVHRVLVDGGRLALSDVVVEGPRPAVPPPLERAFCLEGGHGRTALRGALDRAGFDVGEVVDHRRALLAMRDRARSRVDYRALLGAMGETGRDLLDGIEHLESAIEAGDVGYISLVAEAREAPDHPRKLH